jgi:hypothetical protein
MRGSTVPSASITYHENYTSIGCVLRDHELRLREPHALVLEVKDRHGAAVGIQQ